MKWIHSNIEHFSGDNQRITLFGQSTGSINTNFHMLSKKSRKYFRNAILMSGTVDIVWALASNGAKNQLSTAFMTARVLGKPQGTFEDLVSFFKTAPANIFSNYTTDFARVFNITMAAVIESMIQDLFSIWFLFVVIYLILFVDSGKDAIRPFIVDPPSKLYEQSKIDVDAIFSLCSFVCDSEPFL